MRLQWDNAVIVDPHKTNHRVIHAGVRMIDASSSQPPSTILAGTNLEDMVFPADMLQFAEGEWTRKPLFEWNDIGHEILVLLPLDVATRSEEYTFKFRVRAQDPKGLRERERKEMIARVGDSATFEQIIAVLKRQPDAREDRDTPLGRLTVIKYYREHLVFTLLDDKLDSVAVDDTMP